MNIHGCTEITTCTAGHHPLRSRRPKRILTKSGNEEIYNSEDENEIDVDVVISGSLVYTNHERVSEGADDEE